MRDFVAEFKAKVREIDGTPTSEQTIEQPVNVRLYSIYKRSLPVDDGINKPVLMNLTSAEADLAMRRLKTHQDHPQSWIYYDKVAQENTAAVSPLYNEPMELTKIDQEVEITQNSTWID